MKIWRNFPNCVQTVRKMKKRRCHTGLSKYFEKIFNCSKFKENILEYDNHGMELQMTHLIITGDGTYSAKL